MTRPPLHISNQINDKMVIFNTKAVQFDYFFASMNSESPFCFCLSLVPVSTLYDHASTPKMGGSSSTSAMPIWLDTDWKCD